MQTRSWRSWGKGGAALLSQSVEAAFFSFSARVPGDRFLQALVEVRLRMVPQLLAGAMDVRQRVANVTRACGAVERRSSEAELLGDGGVDLVERVASSGADVEDAASGDRTGREAGEQVGADRVVDEVEVAAGEAIAEYGGRLACHHHGCELGDDAGVRRVGGLARAKDIEVAQADSFQPISPVESLDVVLAGQLLHGVGRERQRRHVFLLGLHGLVSVGRGGGRVDDAPHLGVARGEQQIQRAVDVGLVRGEGIFYGAGDTGERCLVEDKVDALAGGLHSGYVLQAHLLEVDLVADAGQVVEAAGGEVVDAAHVVSLLDQRVGQG
jgi:hypothetical protein